MTGDQQKDTKNDKNASFRKNSASDSLFTARAIPIEDTPIESNRVYDSTLDRSDGSSAIPIAPSPINIKIKPTTRRTSPAINPKESWIPVPDDMAGKTSATAMVPPQSIISQLTFAKTACFNPCCLYSLINPKTYPSVSMSKPMTKVTISSVNTLSKRVTA